MSTRWSGVFVLCAALVTAGLGGAAKAGFYDTRPDELPGTPGSLIRYEVKNLAPPGATVFRILYRSTGLHDEAIAVSGIAIRPEGANATKGRDIVAWAHGTSGIAQRCAPSLMGQGYGEVPALPELLHQGYAVVITDYPGLGTAGQHPYLIGVSEGRAVLDAVRAIRQIPDIGASDRFVVWGHSQGGHAALFTGELAAHYAPELRLLGVATAAPATEIGALVEDDLTSAAGKILTALTIDDWSKLFSIAPTTLVESQQLADVEEIGRECINDLAGDLADFEAQRPLQLHFLKADPVKTEPWAKLIAENVPGQMPAGAPVFIAQGSADTVVDPPVTEDFVRRLCAGGTRVRFLRLPNVTHSGIPGASAPEALAWIRARFAGEPAPDDCMR